MRLLWTQELVDFAGKYRKLERPGINPLPIQRSLPCLDGRDGRARDQTRRAHR